MEDEKMKRKQSEDIMIQQQMKGSKGKRQGKKQRKAMQLLEKKARKSSKLNRKTTSDSNLGEEEKRGIVTDTLEHDSNDRSPQSSGKKTGSILGKRKNSAENPKRSVQKEAPKSDTTDTIQNFNHNVAISQGSLPAEQRKVNSNSNISISELL
ncbi:MAG: hypothetical protein ACMG6E_04770 [Candidatus Roizmanbacteria bacterium]